MERSGAARPAREPLVVVWLLEFGSRKPAGGAEVVYFDKRSRQRLRRYVGRRTLSKFDELLDVYAVVADGRIITVGHRTRRLRNP